MEGADQYTLGEQIAAAIPDDAWVSEAPSSGWVSDLKPIDVMDAKSDGLSIELKADATPQMEVQRLTEELNAIGDSIAATVASDFAPKYKELDTIYIETPDVSFVKMNDNAERVTQGFSDIVVG